MKAFNDKINIDNKISIFPYINIYQSALPDPDKLLSVIKESENLSKLGPYIDPWERWYEFGEKARLQPHKETKQLTTLNSEHLGMLSAEEDKTFYDQENLFNEIDLAIDTVLKDYVNEWLTKELDESKFNSDWHGKKTIFPEHIKDWDIRSRSGNWVHSSYDILKHKSETHKQKKYAIDFHTDNKPSSDRMPGPKPIMTVTIYLNDDYEGGEVSFLNEVGSEIITYKPKAGDITVFPSYKPFFHAAMPVSKNNKYLIRYFCSYYYHGNEDYLSGVEKFGEDVWRKIEEHRIMAEDRSGMHMKNVVFPGEDQMETFKKWSEIFRLQSSTVAIPFFAEKVTYIDGRINE